MRRVATAAAMAAALLIIGCAAARKPGPPPAWMSPDAPVMDQSHFYGKGCAQHEIYNVFQKRMTARERARTDLAKNVQAYALESLAGDTTSARSAVEYAVSIFKDADKYQDADGNLCFLVASDRKAVEERIAGARR